MHSTIYMYIVKRVRVFVYFVRFSSGFPLIYNGTRTIYVGLLSLAAVVATRYMYNTNMHTFILLLCILHIGILEYTHTHTRIMIISIMIFHTIIIVMMMMIIPDFHIAFKIAFVTYTVIHKMCGASSM